LFFLEILGDNVAATALGSRFGTEAGKSAGSVNYCGIRNIRFQRKLLSS